MSARKSKCCNADVRITPWGPPRKNRVKVVCTHCGNVLEIRQAKEGEIFHAIDREEIPFKGIVVPEPDIEKGEIEHAADEL